MPWKFVGTVVVVVLFIGLLVPVAVASGAPRPTDSTFVVTLAEDPVNATDTDGVTEETAKTVSDVSGTTTEASTDTGGSTVDEPTETVSGTTETVDQVTETADGTAGTADERTEAIETVSETGTTETVDGVTETVDETTGSVGETLERSAEGDASVTETGEVVGNISRTTSETTRTTNGTTESLNETLTAANETLAETTGQLEDGSTVLETPSQRVDGGSTTRSSIDGTASTGGDTTSTEPTYEDASIPPSDRSARRRSTVAPESGRDGEETLPIGGAVGVVALLIGAIAQRGAMTANGCPDALVRGLLSLRRVTTNDTGLRYRLWRSLSTFRYSRFDDSDPLEHQERHDLYRQIENAPGVNLSSLADETNVPLSTARHHLRVLQREGLVDDRKTGGRRRFVPRGYDIDDRVVALDDEATSRVLDALARRGPSSVSLLADELNRDPSTVTHHLQDLEEAGLVERHREGRTVVNRLTPKARSALDAGSDSTPGDDHLGRTE